MNWWRRIKKNPILYKIKNFTCRRFVLLWGHFQDWCRRRGSWGQVRQLFRNGGWPARSHPGRWKRNRGCSRRPRNPVVSRSLSNSKPRVKSKSNRWANARKSELGAPRFARSLVAALLSHSGLIRIVSSLIQIQNNISNNHLSTARINFRRQLSATHVQH